MAGVDPNRKIVAKVKKLDKRAVRNEPDPYHEDRLETMFVALMYIADDAGPADMITIKRVANIALGRESED